MYIYYVIHNFNTVIYVITMQSFINFMFVVTDLNISHENPDEINKKIALKTLTVLVMCCEPG